MLISSCHRPPPTPSATEDSPAERDTGPWTGGPAAPHTLQTWPGTGGPRAQTRTRATQAAGRPTRCPEHGPALLGT